MSIKGTHDIYHEEIEIWKSRFYSLYHWVEQHEFSEEFPISEVVDTEETVYTSSKYK